MKQILKDFFKKQTIATSFSITLKSKITNKLTSLEMIKSKRNVAWKQQTFIKSSKRARSDNFIAFRKIIIRVD